MASGRLNLVTVSRLPTKEQRAAQTAQIQKIKEIRPLKLSNAVKHRTNHTLMFKNSINFLAFSIEFR